MFKEVICGRIAPGVRTSELSRKSQARPGSLSKIQTFDCFEVQMLVGWFIRLGTGQHAKARWAFPKKDYLIKWEPQEHLTLSLGFMVLVLKWKWGLEVKVTWETEEHLTLKFRV